MELSAESSSVMAPLPPLLALGRVAQVGGQFLLIEVRLEEMAVESQEHRPKVGDSVGVYFERKEDQGGKSEEVRKAAEFVEAYSAKYREGFREVLQQLTDSYRIKITEVKGSREAAEHTEAFKERLQQLADWYRLESMYAWLSHEDRPSLEGTVVKGTVVEVENDFALIDVGLKSDGRVALKEFASSGQDSSLKVGDLVEVYVERMEDKLGEPVLSREKAKREEAWQQLEAAFNAGERVYGVIYGRVKGGFSVDLSGAVAFLPGSQVDIRPVRDITPLLQTQQPFQILKMDRIRGNIVVSRRAALEETRAEQHSKLIESLKEGQVLQGVVKDITDYGAFVDLGGVDGLLDVTDISWKRINHPSEALQIGQTVDVQVIRFNPETQRISLGMKQLEADPWDGVEAKYPINAKFTGRVTEIVHFGAFVELEPGIEGLVHVSEMSWIKKNVRPGKIVSTSQEVEVMVLDVDPRMRRISLGIKQCMANPWDDFLEKHPVGAEIEGEVKKTTEFGLLVGLTEEIDGMVQMPDISWDNSSEDELAGFEKGEKIKAKVLSVDLKNNCVWLGIDPTEASWLGSATSQSMESDRGIDSAETNLTSNADFEGGTASDDSSANKALTDFVEKHPEDSERATNERAAIIGTGKWLRAFRNDGMRLQDVADAAASTPATLSLVERGLGDRGPTIGLVGRILSAYGKRIAFRANEVGEEKQVVCYAVPLETVRPESEVGTQKSFSALEQFLSVEPAGTRAQSERTAILDAGNILRKLRGTDKKLQQVADAAGTTPATLSLVERGLGERGPTVGLFVRIINALGYRLVFEI